MARNVAQNDGGVTQKRTVTGSDRRFMSQCGSRDGVLVVAVAVSGSDAAQDQQAVEAGAAAFAAG